MPIVNSAPEMVELQSDQMIINRADVQALLEEVLKVEQNMNNGRKPYEAYRYAMSNAIDMFRFEKNVYTNSEKIGKVQKRVKLVDLYFNHFVQLDPEVVTIGEYVEKKAIEEVTQIPHQNGTTAPVKMDF